MSRMDSSGHARTTYLGVADVADRTGLSTRTIRRYISAGTLPARKAGSRVLVREADLEVWFSHLEPVGVTEPLTTTSTTASSSRGYRW